jgi:hypothetical protein
MVVYRRKQVKLPCGLIRSLPLVVMLLWIGGVLFGLDSLWKYESTSGHVVRSLTQWPASVHLPSLSHELTLVMVVHPCCPCTRASVSELARIMARSHHPTAAYVFFYTPKIAPVAWKETDLYDRVAAIPGVTAVRDEDGREAARFHATVSGQTLLFDAAGHLLYSGGITAARGIEGDSPGEKAILALMRGEQVKRTRFPVFGCSLLSSP